MTKKQTITINDVHQVIDYLKAVSRHDWNPDEKKFDLITGKTDIDFTRFGDRGIQQLIEIIETNRHMFIRSNHGQYIMEHDEIILNEILRQLYGEMRERKINSIL